MFYFIEDPVVVVFMRPEKVVVSHPESQVIVGAVDVVKAVCHSVRGFISTVEPFDHLFERAVLFGDGIVVGKSDYLCDLEGECFPKLFGELHGGQRIGAVTICNEFKRFRELFQTTERHAHGKDTGTDSTVVRDLIADDGPCGSIHDKPDIGFEAPDLDIGFVSSKDRPFFVRKLVYKGFYADCGGFTIVGDLLMGDIDVVQVFKSL